MSHPSVNTKHASAIDETTAEVPHVSETTDTGICLDTDQTFQNDEPDKVQMNSNENFTPQLVELDVKVDSGKKMYGDSACLT